jgi:pyoverdine/dityrosine biosynthesis protein Dit1
MCKLYILKEMYIHHYSLKTSSNTVQLRFAEQGVSLVEPSPSSDTWMEKVNPLLTTLYNPAYRRPTKEGTHLNHDSAPSLQVADSTFSAIVDTAMNNRMLRLVLMGFPVKSPSRHHTRSDHADLGDRLTIRRLKAYAQALNAIHPTKIEMVSDWPNSWATFPDHVTFDNIRRYQQELRQIIREENATGLVRLIDPASLAHWHRKKFVNRLPRFRRDRLEDKQSLLTYIQQFYSQSNPLSAALESRLDAKAIYNRRVYSGLEYSNSQANRLAQLTAPANVKAEYGFQNFLGVVWLNSHVFSRTKGPAIRLSILPKPLDADAISIWTSTPNAQCVPWQSVMAHVGGNQHFAIKNKAALALGLRPVEQKGRFSHYALPVSLSKPQRDELKANIKKASRTS